MTRVLTRWGRETPSDSQRSKAALRASCHFARQADQVQAHGRLDRRHAGRKQGAAGQLVGFPCSSARITVVPGLQRRLASPVTGPMDFLQTAGQEILQRGNVLPRERGNHDPTEPRHSRSREHGVAR